MNGILDRFEKSIAVILIEEANEEIHVEKEDLPHGSEVNTVFHIKKVDGNFQIKGINEEQTKKRAQKSSDLMKKLQGRKKDSKFKKN